jgi:SHS2 domain-containing protein
MPYRYIDDVAIADVAFEAGGTTLEELFRASVDATLGVMVGDPDGLAPLERRDFEALDDSLDLLLFRLLGEVVFHKDASHLLLRCTSCRIDETGDGWNVAAVLEGEQLDDVRQALLDVKAVTLHMLGVERTSDGWKATVVLDI